jgi:nucleotidyltransferase substrate binding protein (TIGR01987 family)
MTEKIDYTSFEKALKNLEERYGDFKTMGEQPIWIEESVKESVIQRFEIVCDLMWKFLRKHLGVELGLPEVPNAPKPVFREAFVNKLLPSDMSFWLDYIDVRNGTSHDYSGEKAQMAIELMDNFIRDVIKLYETMSGEIWHS